jgi:hypothetical protein
VIGTARFRADAYRALECCATAAAAISGAPRVGSITGIGIDCTERSGEHDA